MDGQDILCGISKGTLKFHTKYLAHTLKDGIIIQHTTLKFQELLDLRALVCF